jgi:SAM-dependent methyltransferase
MLRRIQADPRGARALSYLRPDELRDGIALPRVWEILDAGWDECLKGSGNDTARGEFLKAYYEHPVWLVNGAFSEADPGTIADRLAAVRLVAHVNPERVLDYGGGIGTVSRLCAQTVDGVKKVHLIDISRYSETAREHLREFPKVEVVSEAQPPYDAVIATEVFEHVPDPIATVAEINALLRIGGALAASWSFVPEIKCHLPENFHFNRVMLWIVRALGFGFYGFERRGSCAYGFVKHSDLTPAMVTRARRLAKAAKLLPVDRLLTALRGR